MAATTELGVVAISAALQKAFSDGQFPKSIYDNLATAIMSGVEVYVNARVAELEAKIAAVAATIPPPAAK